MDPTQSIGYIYCGVSLFCALVLMLYANIIAKISPRYSIERYVLYSYLCAGFSAIFDCAYALREIVGIQFHPFSSYVLTLIYVIVTNLIGTFWIIYAEKKQNSWFTKTKTRMTIFVAPLVLFIALVLSTPFTHIYFYFEGNSYKRGSLFVILSSLLLVYLVQNGIKSLIRSFKKKYYVERHELRRLFAYSFFYLTIQMVQLALPNIFPYRSIGTMLILGIFINQKMIEMIGVDKLTHINNRNSLDQHLGTLMNQDCHFEVVMIDVDKFKSINDTYGHMEGDRALTLVAEALKEAAPNNSFIARWGGDEFVIVNDEIKHSIRDIEDKINAAISGLIAAQNVQYHFTISAGFVAINDTVNSIPDLLKSADEELYARKSAKKNRTA